jgi:hypothetical protein
MKFIQTLIVTCFFMIISTFYKFGHLYSWLYFLIVALFFLFHFDARFLIKKNTKGGVTYLSTNYLISISSSLIYLIFTLSFILFLIYKIRFDQSISSVTIAFIYVGSLAHLTVPLYFLSSFYKNYSRNKNDYIALSSNQIEVSDNGKVTSIDLKEFGNKKYFIIQGSDLRIADKGLNLKNIGLTQISIKKLVLNINDYYENIH